jgi:hypothetical protein
VVRCGAKPSSGKITALEYGVRALRCYAPFGKKRFAWKHELAEDLCVAPVQ